MADPFRLQRFVDAQAAIYDTALSELRRGRKASHWMWFVFPQLRGLGQSATAREYGIVNLAEANAYANHHILGPRLLECTGAVNAVEGRSAHDIFGAPDDMKFRSSMTLFELANPDVRLFGDALDRYYDGERDERTISLLAQTDA